MDAMDTQKFKEYLSRAITERKWAEAALEYIDGFQRIQKEREQAVAERDKAVVDRDKAVAEVDAKRAKYEADFKAALEDLARVTKEKAEAAKKAQATAQAKLDALAARTVKALEETRLAEAQRDAYREEAHREALEIQARNGALLHEEQTIRERLAAALGR